MRHRAFLVFAILVFAAVLPAPAQSASPQLAGVLQTLRNLSDSSFQQVVWWAPSPSDPGMTVPDWNNAEHRIMQLKHKDRAAVLSWLTGNGRQALYDRGATDAMIGPRRSVDTSYAPSSPSPLARYRAMQLTSETLRSNAPPPGGINVMKGFALIAKDGTNAIVCLSFTNVGALAAKSVHFQFPLLDDSGNTLGTIDFNRTGLFSPNIAINGPAHPSDYFDPGLSNRGAFDNCVTSRQGVAAMPLLQARHVTFKVAGVTYTDGSTWP